MAKLRVVVLGSALIAFSGCGTGESPPPPSSLILQTIRPTVVGARSADFQLSVVGAGMGPNTAVVVGGTECHIGQGVLGPGPSFGITTVPGGAAGMTSPGTVKVYLKNGDGSRSEELSLAIQEAPAPVLSGITGQRPACSTRPASGFKIRGANFTLDTRLEINGQPVSIERMTSTALLITTPAGVLFPNGAPASVKVSVPAPGGGDASGEFVDDGAVDCE